MSARSLALALPLLASTAAANHVIVVNNSSTLSQVMKTAQNGDILLLKSGTYSSNLFVPPFNIVNRSMSLVADANADVQFQSPVTLSNSTDAAPALWQRLKFSQSLPGAPLINALASASPLWIEGCTVTQAPEYPSSIFTNVTATNIGNCASLVLHDCALRGGDGSTSQIGGSALVLQQASATLHGCTLSGGKGATSKAGGAGVLAVGGFTLATGCTLAGGNGGDGASSPSDPNQCTAGGAGGVGLKLINQASAARLDVDASGGQGGAGAGTCGGGANAGDVDATGGTLTTLSGAARNLALSSPVREGQTLSWTLSGEPGDLAFLDYGTQPGFAYVEAWNGALLLTPPFFVAFVGVVPASGIVQGTALINDLGPGVEGAILWAQAGFFDGASVFQAAPSATVLLDQAF